MEDILQIVDRAMSDMDSGEVQALMLSLPEDNEKACAKFCDRFELGNFFYEALLFHGIPILELVDRMRVLHQIHEEAMLNERSERESELRSAVGW